MSTRSLKRAIAKAQPFADTAQWCGYFTPSEILALVEDGHRAACASDVDGARERAAAGHGNPQWFYFYATGQTVLTNAKLGAHDKRHPSTHCP